MSQKKQEILEKEISEIMIVGNRKLAPYIEAVNFSSQNIDQRKLGTILGIFEIKDTSEDSAYIVNFLASVAKKTYFASHHKTALESFEATLYRLNLSLSEVAKHGNVNWIGKIDAVICSIDDKEIHFSVSGDAKVLLLRDGNLTEISSGLSPKDEAVNPIKTFTDIASGKLEGNDKLIITTDDISHVFTLKELETHSLSFAKKDFLRFLKTALVNELDIAGTIVVDVNKKIIENKQVAPQKNKVDEEKLIEQNINAFSNKTFAEVSSNKQATIEEVTEADPEKNDNEYTHEKTGHIYIKDPEENYKPEADNNIKKLTFNCKEGIFKFCFWIKDRYLKKGNYLIKKNISSGISSVKEQTGHFFKDTFIGSATKLLKSIGSLIHNVFISTGNSIKKIIPEKSKEIDVEIENNIQESKKNKLAKMKKAVTSMFPGKGSVSGITASEKPMFEKNIEPISRQPKFSLSFLKKIIPNFSKIIRVFSRMSRKNKLYILGVVLFILVTPIFIIKIQNKKNEIITEVNEDKNHREEMAVNPSSDKYIDAEKIYFGENILGVITFGESILIISEDKIVKSHNGEILEYSLPEPAKGARAFSFMEDLNLIFLINGNKQITSFSPISGKFSENSIDIPGDAEINAIGTYLTYIYLVDSKNNQIYRYPRAEGGFGEKADWLKDTANFENITSMAIDENIYLIQNGDLSRFSRGKREEFNLAKDGDSNIEELYTNDDLGFIYAIDKQNGELIKFGKDGSLKTHHSNQELLRATSLWTDTDSEWSYFSTENEIFKIKTP
jgi:hypothetical protein